jgi:hypothetical protein
VRAKFEAVVKDGEGTILGALFGEYELPEISNDSGDDEEDWQVKVSFLDNKHKLLSRVEQPIKK